MDAVLANNATGFSKLQLALHVKAKGGTGVLTIYFEMKF